MALADAIAFARLLPTNPKAVPPPREEGCYCVGCRPDIERFGGGDAIDDDDGTGSIVAGADPRALASSYPPPPPNGVLHWDALSTRGDECVQSLRRKRRRNALFMSQLRALHCHCFPVAYDDRFYNSITAPDGVMVTVVATAPFSALPASSEFYPPPESGQMLNTCYMQAPDPSLVAEPGEGDAPDASRVIIGVITVRVRAAPGAIGGGVEGYIATLGVRDDCRRLGLGDALLARALAAVFNGPKPCVRAWLHCLSPNDPAVALYMRHNFIICDFLPAFYSIHGQRYDANVLCRVNPCGAADPAGGTAARARLLERLGYDARYFAVEPDDNESALQGEGPDPGLEAHAIAPVVVVCAAATAVTALVVRAIVSAVRTSSSG